MEKEHWEYLSHIVSCQEKQIQNSLIMRPETVSELKKINVILKYIDNNLDAGGALCFLYSNFLKAMAS